MQPAAPAEDRNLPAPSVCLLRGTHWCSSTFPGPGLARGWRPEELLGQCGQQRLRRPRPFRSVLPVMGQGRMGIMVPVSLMKSVGPREVSPSPKVTRMALLRECQCVICRKVSELRKFETGWARASVLTRRLSWTKVKGEQAPFPHCLTNCWTGICFPPSLCWTRDALLWGSRAFLPCTGH